MIYSEPSYAPRDLPLLLGFVSHGWRFHVIRFSKAVPGESLLKNELGRGVLTAAPVFSVANVR